MAQHLSKYIKLNIERPTDMGLCGKYNSNTRVVVKCLYMYLHSSE